MTDKINSYLKAYKYVTLDLKEKGFDTGRIDTKLYEYEELLKDYKTNSGIFNIENVSDDYKKSLFDNKLNIIYNSVRDFYSAKSSGESSSNGEGDGRCGIDLAEARDKIRTLKMTLDHIVNAVPGAAPAVVAAAGALAGAGAGGAGAGMGALIAQMNANNKAKADAIIATTAAANTGVTNGDADDIIVTAAVAAANVAAVAAGADIPTLAAVSLAADANAKAIIATAAAGAGAANAVTNAAALVAANTAANAAAATAIAMTAMAIAVANYYARRIPLCITPKALEEIIISSSPKN